MINNNWKRFLIIEKVIQILLMLSIIIPVFCEIAFNRIIPINFQGYFFFCCLGLFIGFKLSKKEYMKALEKMNGK
jgi:hypothetical protein